MKPGRILISVFLGLIFMLFLILKLGSIKKIYKNISGKIALNKKRNIQHKLSSLFFFNVHGKNLGRIAKRFLKKYKPGGIILMSNNVRNAAQVKLLIQKIRSIYNENQFSKITPIISIDQEGGRVRRIKKGVLQFPSAKISAEKGIAFVRDMATKVSIDLLNLGINVNFAPVADVLKNKKNKVIGDRAFGDNENIVSRMVKAYLNGAKKTNIINCVKHFPGHGNVEGDSHKVLPIDYSTEDELLIKPFKAAIKNNVSMIMTAHILFPKIDNKPATMSAKILSMLRKKLKFKGIIISDDLSMKALTKKYSKAKVVVNALKAGVNMFIHTAVKYKDHINLLKSAAKLIAKDSKALLALELSLNRVKLMKKRIYNNY